MEVVDAKLVDLERRSPQLLQEIRELKTERNTHAPISKLPDEVLLEIFMVMMAHSRFEDWHMVAHVCHRWRNVALGAPMLWIHPPTNRHHLTTLMLERSKESNLTIYLDASTSTETAQAIFNCIGRIESLELNDRYSEPEGEFPHEFFLQQTPLLASTQEASSLKSLQVAGDNGDFWNSRPMMQFLRPMVWQLNKLLLANVYFEWSVLPLNNLTHLTLEHVMSIGYISMRQLIETLGQMPLLEELELSLSDDIHLDIQPPHTLPATTEANLTLPFLRLLSLPNSYPGHLFHFFAHTTFPRLRGLVMGIVDFYGEFINNYYSSVIQAAASLVNNGDFGTFDRVVFVYRSFALSMLDANGHSSYIHIDIDIRATLDREAESYTGARIMLDLAEMCRPNFSRLLHLHLHSVPIEAECRRLFGGTCLSYLQKIAINKSEILPTLTSALGAHLPDPSELVDVPISNLRSISCDFVRFADSSVLDAFIDCLMLRREYGHSLHELLLYSCSGMTSVQLTRLKEVVVNLDCTDDLLQHVEKSGENN